MQASTKNLLDIIKAPKQFTIPIYQRTYSWGYEQCGVLLKDIQEASKAKKSHFIGSIVYFQPHIYAGAEINKYLVIDGQQRLTTITLLISALVKFIKKNPGCKIETTAQKLKNYYLFNANEEDDLYFKLLLTRRDKETLKFLLTGGSSPEKPSSKIIANSKYFCEQINKNNINKIYQGLRKLIIIDVVLEKEDDDPKLIFESLNSTGLHLTQTDLTSNYIFMGEGAKSQKNLYENYWYPMEQIFGENIDYLTRFMRDYLTMKLSSTL